MCLCFRILLLPLQKYSMESTVSIGFDAKRLVRNGTGLGNYGRTLVGDLSVAVPSGWRLLLYVPDEGREELRAKVCPSSDICWRYPAARTGLGRALWRTGSGLVTDLQRDGVQLYHGLSGELPRGIRAAGIRSVVTIHDLIFLRHPEFYPWLDARVYAWKFRNTCREADRIIAISERTKRDVIELGGVGEDRIDVVYQSCDAKYAAPLPVGQVRSVLERYGVSGRYVLSVGTIEERKNLALAVRALDYLPEDVHLVAVGRRTRYAERLPSSSRVHLLSGVGDDELAALYQGAEVFVYPSRYEGFGIPVIEAIHSGLPVVACTGSCLEEAGGPDSLYVDPDDAPGMGQALQRLLKGAEGRDERIRRSREWVRRFEGRDVAGQVLAIYEKLLNL